VQHLHVRERAPADMPLEPVPDGLHLWQLWHRGRPAFPLGPALLAARSLR
jgi:hypothetical protein